MTTLATGLSSQNRANGVSCQGNIYLTNGFDPVKVWNGISTTLLDAGIDGPSAAITGVTSTAAGGFTNGDHLLRYRYRNSKNGFVSNPSPPFAYTVTGGNGLLTFNIDTAATPILTTTDTKVDTIVVEATRTGGGAYYEVGTAANSTGSIQVGADDDALSQLSNSDTLYGGLETFDTYSASKPPLGAILVAYRGRLWVLGDYKYSITSSDWTNGSDTISGTGFNTLWPGYIITKDGDSQSYEIQSATTTAITLTTNYGGTTSTSTAYVVKKDPNIGHYSRAFYPEQFYINNWARKFLDNKSDQVRAAIGGRDGLYVFGLVSAERLVYNADPAVSAGAVISPIHGHRGCWNQRCLVDMEGDIFAWDAEGMWIVQDRPQHISNRIDKLLEETIDFTQYEQFHAAYDPASRSVLYFYVRYGDTVPKEAAVFERDTGRWSLISFMQGITASSIVPTEDGVVRLMLGDENGYTWYYGITDSFDGPPSTSPTVVTVTGSPSTTVIPVNETLPTSGSALNGVMVYDPVSGESRYSSSNTASTITVASAFTSAPTVGQDLYLGAIDVEYIGKWITGQSQTVVKNPTYLVLSFYPGSATGQAKIYFYSDFATTPSTFTAGASDTFPDGVTVGNGNNYAVIDLDGGDTDGVLYIPIPVEWHNSIQVKVTSIRPDGDFRLLNMDMTTSKRQVMNDAD